MSDWDRLKGRSHLAICFGVCWCDLMYVPDGIYKYFFLQIVPTLKLSVLIHIARSPGFEVLIADLEDPG